MSVIVHTVCVFEVRRHSHCEDISGTALLGLATLNFDLSTCKWGNGSPVLLSSFLPIFVLLGLRVTHGTDRQTDRRRHKRLTPMFGRGRFYNKQKSNV